MNKSKYVNLGCGNRFHKDWVNVDFISSGEGVIAHNLLQGIPFEEECFDVVYHAHVLEHFSKSDGEQLIRECYRVLKPQGILRIAVPDLEQIVREYINHLDSAIHNDPDAAANYEWIMLEMYDQTVRHKSGGGMATYLFQDEIPNESYVFSRIGEEGRELRNTYLERLKQSHKQNSKPKRNTSGKAKNWLRSIKNRLRSYLINRLLPDYQAEHKYLELGKFRLGGEIHQWMYDRYSLKKLLIHCGFKEVSVKTAFESDIPDWNLYELESRNGIIYKPDSLFMEAKK